MPQRNKPTNRFVAAYSINGNLKITQNLTTYETPVLVIFRNEFTTLRIECRAPALKLPANFPKEIKLEWKRDPSDEQSKYLGHDRNCEFSLLFTMPNIKRLIGHWHLAKELIETRSGGIKGNHPTEVRIVESQKCSLELELRDLLFEQTVIEELEPR